MNVGAPLPVASAPPQDPNLVPYASWDAQRQGAWVAALQQYRYDNVDAWSTRLWVDGHTFTLEYPDVPNAASRAAAAAFFKTTFAGRIRCGHCRVHYDAAAARVEEHTASRGALVAWFIRVHNLVNAKLKRPTLAPEDALSRYMAPSVLGAALRSTLSASPFAAFQPHPLNSSGSGMDVVNWVALLVLVLVICIGVVWAIRRWKGHSTASRSASLSHRGVERARGGM